MPRPPLPTKLWPALVGSIRGSPAYVVLILGLVAYNTAQMLALIIRPFSRRVWLAINRTGSRLWISTTVLAARRLLGIRVVITGDDVPSDENAIVIANHQQMPDITFLTHLAYEKGRTADLRFFAKEALKYTPGLGWGMWFYGYPFVKRDWTRDRASIARVFERIIAERLPTWLIIFPEGTRGTLDKLGTSRAYARAQGLQPLRHVQIPRTKGFVASVLGLYGFVDAVYDVTIGYPDGVPTLAQYACGLSRIAHLHVRRYSVGELPATQEGLAQWLLARFADKDRLLAALYEEGTFPEWVSSEPVAGRSSGSRQSGAG